MIKKPCLCDALLLCMFLLFDVPIALSQNYPERPLRFIVPNSPGTQVDLMARVIGPEMSKVLGQPIVVENKTGAGELIGYEYLATYAPSDGYTFGMVAVTTLATLPVNVKELRFDPLKDIPPFIGILQGKYAFGSSSALPWKTFAELVSYAKANPGKLNYGSQSTNIRLLAEALIGDFGTHIVHIPYSTGAGYLRALLSSEIHMAVISEANANSFGEKFRILAVTGDQRRPPYMGIPTFAELGHPEIRGSSYSLNARAGTAKPFLEKLFAAASSALQQQEVKAYFAKQRYEILVQTPEIAAQRLAEEAKVFADLARKVGISPK